VIDVSIKQIKIDVPKFQGLSLTFFFAALYHGLSQHFLLKAFYFLFNLSLLALKVWFQIGFSLRFLSKGCGSCFLSSGVVHLDIYLIQAGSLEV